MYLSDGMKIYTHLGIVQSETNYAENLYSNVFRSYLTVVILSCCLQLLLMSVVYFTVILTNSYISSLYYITYNIADPIELGLYYTSLHLKK